MSAAPSGDAASGILDRTLRDIVAVACRVAVEPLVAEVASLRRTLEDRMPAAFVSRTEAAAQLRVSVDSIDRMVRDGRLTSRRVGRAVRIDAASLRPATEADVVALASIARAP